MRLIEESHLGVLTQIIEDCHRFFHHGIPFRELFQLLVGMGQEKEHPLDQGFGSEPLA